MQYKLCDDTWDNKELEAIQRVIVAGHFSMAGEVKRYEEEFAKKFGAGYVIMVSSGSAANLFAFQGGQW